LIEQTDLEPIDPINAKIIELYINENKIRAKSQIPMIRYLILISPNKKKISFVAIIFSHDSVYRFTKELTTQDIIFLRKLDRLEFNKIIPLQRFFSDRDGDIREEVITELSEDKEKISLDVLQELLNFHNNKEFHLQVFEWVKKYRFRIDGNYLLFKTDSLEKFIQELNEIYKEWNVSEKIYKKK